MSVVRHLAGPDAVAEDYGLTRAKFDEIVRWLTALPISLGTDTDKTLGDIARETRATEFQVRSVWQAWVRTDQHPAARR